MSKYLIRINDGEWIEYYPPKFDDFETIDMSKIRGGYGNPLFGENISVKETIKNKYKNRVEVNKR